MTSSGTSDLTADLGRQVRQTLPKNEQEPDERGQALVDSLRYLRLQNGAPYP
jgi:hypothetical protein